MLDIDRLEQAWFVLRESVGIGGVYETRILPAPAFLVFDHSDPFDTLL